MRRRCAAVGLLLAAYGCGGLSEEERYRQSRSALQRGDLQAAAAQATEGLRRARQSDSADWARHYRLLEVEILIGQRRSHEALALLQEMGIASEQSPELRARALLARAYVRCLLDSSTSAAKDIESDFVDAERTVAEQSRQELKGELLLRRGACAVEQGDFATAEMHLLAALHVARSLRSPALEASATGSLGRLSLKREHYDQAVDWLERSLDLARSSGADGIVLKTLGNLGWGHLQLGDLDRARSSLSQARALAERLGYIGDLRVFLTIIGNVHFRLGDYEQARSAWERALAIGRDLGDRRAISENLGSIALIALEERRYDEAERCAQETLRLEQEIGETAEQEETRLTQARILAVRGGTARAEALFRAVIASPHTTDAIRWETHAAFAALLVSSRRSAEAEREFGRAFDVMEGMRSGLRVAEHKITFFSSLARYYDDYVDFLMQQGKPSVALAVADRSRALYLREVLSDQAGNRASADARLQDIARAQGASLLLYWTAPQRSFVWCVTPSRIDARELPGEEALSRRVDAYQRAVQRSRDPLAEVNADGIWLYRTLVEPVATYLQGGRVVIVPDGPLHRLSFDTLIAPAPQPHYWIEDVTLALAPALGLMDTATAKTASGARRSILLIGDPLPASAEFPALPQAHQEIARIGAQFPAEARVVYAGAEAEPGVYKTALPGRFAYIHFAAHATPNREQPLESAVILSAKNDAFKLHARDIVSTQLSAELVTLSACYGAGSRSYAGEGFVGLAWSFMGSGARNVVAGLWNVEESSTVDVMEALYRGLGKGQAPPDALRAAKLELLHSRSAYRKPYYWAPFVAYTRHWQ